MSTTLTGHPVDKTVTLADGNVLAIICPAGMRRMVITVDSGGADVAVTTNRGSQTDGQAPSGSDYHKALAGGGLEDIELPDVIGGTTIYIWRLSATSTTVRLRGEGAQCG